MKMSQSFRPVRPTNEILETVASNLCQAFEQRIRRDVSYLEEFNAAFRVFGYDAILTSLKINSTRYTGRIDGEESKKTKKLFRLLVTSMDCISSDIEDDFDKRQDLVFQVLKNAEAKRILSLPPPQ